MGVFQVKGEYFGRASLGNTERYTWKLKGISNENFYFSDSNVATKLTKPMHVSFGLDQFFFFFFLLFLQDAAKVFASSVVNVYICYKLLPKTINTDKALKYCLFGAIEAARPNNTNDPDNFIYSGYGICFDHTGTFTHSESGIARNVIIFGVDMSGSVHASNKTKDFLVLGKGPIQMIEKKLKSTQKNNFSAGNKIFVLSLHYKGGNYFLFVNVQKVAQFKAKDSIISNQNTRALTLGTLTTLAYLSGANNRLSPKNINDTKLYGNAYDFSVDYSPISNENILKIHKYLMKKNGLIYCNMLQFCINVEVS